MHTSKMAQQKLAKGSFQLSFSILVISALIVLALDVEAAAAEKTHHHHHHHRRHLKLPKVTTGVHAIMKSSCANTRYPELCMSSLSGYSGADNLTCQKDVILASLNMTASAVEESYLHLEKSEKAKGLSPRAKTAFHDCLVLMGETLDELELTVEKLRVYPTKEKSVTDHACDLKILLSGAMTNQRACLGGFSFVQGHEQIRKFIKESASHVYRMASNSLAMVTNMTDSDIANEEQLGVRRRLMASASPIEVDDDFPKWMSPGDRKLLQDTDVAADLVVAADGSGNVRTVWEAINRAPEGSGRRFVIRIKGGVYRENVEVSARKTNIMLVGDGKGVTVITGSRSAVSGSTTFSSATFGVMGNGFVARDITFQNTAGSAKGQAVALRVGSDFSVFYKCEISGYQDTLYAYSMRQFYRDCTITGTIDFIFGNAAAVFQNCDILARRPLTGQNNDVTAQSRSDQNQNTGFSIQNCRIGGTSDLGSVKTYLGRPWMAYSRVVVMKSTISNVIDPAGWDKWIGNYGQDTSYYGEYMNNGPGAGTQNRVRWRAFRVMSDAEAQRFTLGNFIGGANWLGATGLPFSLSL